MNDFLLSTWRRILGVVILGLFISGPAMALAQTQNDPSENMQLPPLKEVPSPVSSNDAPKKEINPLSDSSTQTSEQRDSSESQTPTETIVLYAGLRKTADLPIDLPTVLKLVDSQNLLIDDQYLNSKLAKNNFYRTMTEGLPDTTWTYSQSHTAGTFQIFGNSVLNFTQTRVSPGLNISVPVYLGGRTIFESIAAHRRFKSQAKLLDSTRQEQLVLAGQEYYHLLEAATLYQNALQSIQEADTQVKLNEARLRVGVGTKLELMQAQTNLADKRRLAIEAQRNLAQAEQALLARLNLEPTVHLKVSPETNLKTRLISSDQNWDQMLSNAIRQHPDMQRLNFELKALNMDLAARASDVVPAMTVNYAHGYVGPNWGDLGAQRSTTLTFQSSLTQNGGLAFPLDLRRIFLQRQQTKTQRDQLTRSIQTQVINAKTNMDAAENAIEVAEYALVSSQEAYRLATGRFRVGLAIFLDVLTAQSALTDARNKFISAITAYNQTQLAALDALGVASPETILSGYQLSVNTKQEKKPDSYSLKQDSGIAIKKENAIKDMILLPVTSPPALPPAPKFKTQPTPASQNPSDTDGDTPQPADPNPAGF